MMNETTKAALVFSAVGFLYISLGIPLLFDQIPPNAWYGCRTKKTLSDNKVWYAVNRVTGRDLILGGIAVLISTVIIFLFGEMMNPTYVALIPLGVSILCVVFIVVNSWRTQRLM